MSDDRWPRVKALFQAAVELPTAERDAFLAAAAGDDDALRREVESLLTSDAANVSFLDRLPVAGAALLGDPLTALPASRDQTLAHPVLTSGLRVGPYEVVAPLGAGAMGEVYRARDTKLNREVALKVLPELFAFDPDRLARFKHEAQVLASLNHPNIAAIYGFEESNGAEALVLELVDGPTLADVIAGTVHSPEAESLGSRPRDSEVAATRGGETPRGLEINEALTIARQIAEALEAAHDKGIIHRDLKPANVKLTQAGVVKVLDFGLAKAAAEAPTLDFDLTQSPPATMDGTREGVILGTAAYMSPEQARGMTVDRRTDMWAFGCVLFEILTGRKPFAGDTVSDTIAAVLEREPPWTALPRRTPARIVRLLRRCLQKDQAQRLRDMADARIEIENVLTGRANLHLRLTWKLIGAAAALALAVGVFLLLRSDRRAPPGRSEWVELTNLDSVTQPALSPDGRMIAFIRGTGTFTTPGQIYVKRLPNGEPVPLTYDDLPKMGPVFSPDGGRIAYTVTDGNTWDTWIVPAIRGEPRRWLRNASGLTWFGASELQFSEIKAGQHMAIVRSNESRAEARDLYVPRLASGMAHRSYSSPDGKWVLVVEMEGVWLPCRLVSTDGGSSRPVGPPSARCTGAAWAPDGKWMYFSANAGDGFHIWRQRFPQSEPEQITSGPTEEEGLAIAADGRTVITSVGLTQRAVWVHDASGERQISLEGYAYWPLLSSDGRRACFRVTRGPGTGQSPSELWMTDLGSGRNERIFPGQMVTGYDVSRDDRVVASVMEPDGKTRVWTAWLDGREPPRRIPGAEGDNPRFGREDEILFRVTQGDSPFLVRIREDGTGRETIPKVTGSVFGTTSPDGEWLSGLDAGMSAYSTRGGPPIRIFPASMRSRLRWGFDDKQVYLSVQYGEMSAFAFGRTYLLPVAKGSVLPRVPAGGFQTEAELAAVPGVEILPYGDLAPGPSPSVYAFSRTTTTRNLYRIPLP